MTVNKLIELLQQQPGNLVVVSDLHSEFAEVEEVRRIVGYDNGGYVSRPYSSDQILRSHGYVYVGVVTHRVEVQS